MVLTFLGGNVPNLGSALVAQMILFSEIPTAITEKCLFLLSLLSAENENSIFFILLVSDFCSEI